MSAASMRKSPRSLAARGLSVEWLGVACDTTPCSPKYSPESGVNQALCVDCHFFVADRVNARLRFSCLFFDEERRPSTPACEFWPGVCGVEGVL